MKFDSLDKIAPDNLGKNLRTALKDSGGKPADLHFIHGRADKKTNEKKPNVVLIGEMTAGFLNELKGTEKLGYVKGTVAETEDSIVYQSGASSLTEKTLAGLLVAAGIRKKPKLVDDVAVALQEATAPKKEAAPVKPQGEDVLLKAAEAKWKLLQPRFALAEKQAPENYQGRLAEMKKAIDKCIADGNGKDAAKLVVGVEKLADEVTRPHELQKDKYDAEVKALLARLDAFKKPPPHEKHRKAIETDLGIVTKSVAELKAIEPKVLEPYLQRSRETLDEMDDLLPEFRGQQADLAELGLQLTALATDIETVRRTRSRELRLLEDADQKAQGKTPTALLVSHPFAPFGTAIDMRSALIKFVKANLPQSAVETETDPVKLRQKRYVHDNPTTWEIKDVEYLNNTSESDIGSGLAALLKKGQLSSNTTAGGKVLKANYEGHVHLASGSGGMAFVYRREPDYTVTPVVVDISSKRGGKNGNQYAWDTGGGMAYFPSNANY